MKKQKKETVQKEVKTENKDWKKMLVDLENKLVEVSKKLPQLPDSVGEFLVKYGPYLIIVGLVAGVISILSVFGLMAAYSPFMGMAYRYGYTGGYRVFLPALIGLIPMVLQAIAVPGLLKRAKSAWNLVFYASLVSVVTSLFGGNLMSGLVGVAINWYFLFQIRKFYK